MSTGSWRDGFKTDYNAVFVEEWSPYLGALAIVGVIIALMASGLFWGVFGGLRLWGDWFNSFIGLNTLLGHQPRLENPLLHRISLMDITLLLGAFSAALLSGQFRVNRPPPVEYLWGALGGTLMGIGATLAGGCTVGGFFTPLIFLSPAGWAMLVGLLIGAYLGLKMLMWVLETVTWGTVAPKQAAVPSGVIRLYPWIGVAVVAAILFWAASWYGSEDKILVKRAVIVIAGFALGFILHRSRFCFSRAIREPLMTGEGTLTKASILALAVGISLSSVLFANQIIDPYLAIPATFWLGSLIGGAIFGVGMIFAGGCASGSLWRMGEGHLKLWVTVFFFAWSGSTFGAILRKWEVMKTEMTLDLVEATKVGIQAYLPDMGGGWLATYLVSFGLLLLWYGLVRFNESTGHFTID
ncbi:MAG: YeeE/YedE family protein [Rhodospirillales bacterium]|nr:YeeE/YedE family protein [Rhodospirillales bacterium]